jgi:enoyl-CoA hydratase/carnithine racemase/carbon monoxide dehydrogenase subunit G
MEMVGESRLRASRERVWDSLNDPSVLQASIPGCEALERTGENTFNARVVSKIGPIKARLAGKVTLSNVVAPHGYRLTGEGSGGGAGFVKAEIEVELDALEPQLTLLRYRVKASLGGKLAQVGSRMIDITARSSTEKFFELFGRQVEVGAAFEPVAQSESIRLVADFASGADSDRVSPAPDLTQQAAPLAATMPATAAASDGANAAVVSEVLTLQLIKVWITDLIAVVTLNRPGSRNAMTDAMLRTIPVIIGALERNPEVAVVIVTGADNDFCAGAEIDELTSGRDDTGQAVALQMALDAACDAIENISKPTIAVVRGCCLDGGAQFAISCDFRYASADAVFGFPAGRKSIIPGARAARRLLALIGLPTAKRILFDALQFPAAEAMRIGFVDHVATGASEASPSRWFHAAKRAKVADPMVEARALARSLAGNAPLSIAGAKAMLNRLVLGDTSAE